MLQSRAAWQEEEIPEELQLGLGHASPILCIAFADQQVCRDQLVRESQKELQQNPITSISGRRMNGQAS
jgi:hypothetical protein